MDGGEEMKLFEALGHFAHAMNDKLESRKMRGWKGWNTISENSLRERLRHNIETEDWVDVANLAMFLWARQIKRKSQGFTHEQ
jgi:hypothetical protein